MSASHSLDLNSLQGKGITLEQLNAKTEPS